ncbi:glucose-specific PTS transporter subunit IIBC [Marininema halotolerans]|uniref:PTS system, D-glucosamine-specific IIC component n=1 Tax=Marininema halotolerans TaxID=1155944 RepID=A0A1I6REA9_9BACL|nr:glucose-specific PTS transporter subunit IIBC [Marininema halotolerans]SFS62920.1 PTS system, D-glucosamine-specific IIC component [Marininema halotolerans]
MLKRTFGNLQQIGRSLMLPVAILPAAGLLLGIGHAAKIPLMEQAGGIIFSNLALIFAIGVAIGLTDNEGSAGLAAVVGFLIMSQTMGILAQNAHIKTDMILGIKTMNMGVFGGIIIGWIAALLHRRFHDIKLPQFLGFFSGRRFVPIITAIVAFILGIVFFYVWPPIQQVIDSLSVIVTKQNTALAAFIFGLIERSLIPFGLHHIFYAPFWYEFGTYKNAAGEIFKGDQARFFAGDPTAGTFLSGKFPFMMFGLPAAALAMYHEARPEKKKLVGGIMLSAALTSFLTGITEPIEFSFLFVAPLLFAIHAVFAGISFMVLDLLGVKAGLTFSGGIIDYFLFFTQDTKPLLIIPVGLVFAVIYYFGFRFAIRRFDLKTPGREDPDEKDEESNIPLEDDLAYHVLDAFGGADNIDKLDACITRLRIQVNQADRVEKDRLKRLGATGVLVYGTNVQAIFGTQSDSLKEQMKDIIRGKAPRKREELVKEDPQPVVNVTDGRYDVVAPMSGKILPLSEVPDEVFSSKMMGDGFAIEPSDGIVVSPVDGKIVNIFPTKHAIGIRAENGMEILLHIGIDTVQLKGEGFELYVDQDDIVTKGQNLLAVDLTIIRKKAKSIVTPVVITNMSEGEKLTLLQEGAVVKKGEGEILTITTS